MIWQLRAGMSTNKAAGDKGLDEKGVGHKMLAPL